MIEFTMPSLGADMEAGTLSEWLVKAGDKVKRGDIIAVVDTQKGLIDIEVFDEGVIQKLVTKEGEKVPVGSVLALILSDKEQGNVKEEKPEISPIIEAKATEKVAVVPPARIKASPLAKKIASDQGIDLTNIKGTGEEGVITKEDVEKAIAAKEKPQEVKRAASSETIRMAIAAAMSKSNKEIPHYYLQTKIDMRNSLNWLSEANKQRSLKNRLLPVALLLKATAKALTIVPDLNAYWENGLQRKADINIGFVISLRGGGLMIPAIHDGAKKSVDEIMATLSDIIPRARVMKLRSSELSDSTITVTNLGEGSVETVFGVIYPPQVAIVGFGNISEQPWAENGMLDVRPVLSVTLAADHRATDGHIGSRFLTELNNILQNPEAI
ncbi:dihydrolipoamide acetyltransferase family protein [Segetibacter koreensis]|uniref:dihydrolipoamide acetyltransferase family protein n=1 Tax=Segetibacter koreensis TaxID=398037 RepID=UPI00038242D2|nr:dihydrolipoamide acetyltransferase family protein [Segetibacter koreensis]